MKLDSQSYVIFDGAMGTMIQRYLDKPGLNPELLNITHPEIIEQIHRAYSEAGSDVITANTFGALETKLAGTGYTVEEVVTKAVTIARKAAENKFVALSLGPSGMLMEPYGELSFEEAYDLYARPVKAAAFTGEVDFVLLETFFDLTEAQAALKAVKDHSSLPAICTFTFQAQGKTLMGNDAKKVVTALGEFGADAVGANCSLGPSEMLPIAETMLSATKLPILIQPNAGLPILKDGKTVYDVDPKEFAKCIKEIAHLGIKWFGGCCGTTPEFIRAIREEL